MMISLAAVALYLLQVYEKIVLSVLISHVLDAGCRSCTYVPDFAREGWFQKGLNSLPHLDRLCFAVLTLFYLSAVLFSSLLCYFLRVVINLDIFHFCE